LSFVEKYIETCLPIVCDFDIAGPSYRIDFSKVLDREINVAESSRTHFSAYSGEFNSVDNGNQQLVLVLDVGIVKALETVVPSPDKV
jgi:hypothetical protein